jgi:hypothetical protein
MFGFLSYWRSNKIGRGILLSSRPNRLLTGLPPVGEKVPVLIQWWSPLSLSDRERFNNPLPASIRVDHPDLLSDRSHPVARADYLPGSRHDSIPLSGSIRQVSHWMRGRG